jgi:hypothetical protein
MPQIRPITDLRNTTEISEVCHMSQLELHCYCREDVNEK